MQGRTGPAETESARRMKGSVGAVSVKVVEYQLQMPFDMQYARTRIEVWWVDPFYPHLNQILFDVCDVFGGWAHGCAISCDRFRQVALILELGWMDEGLGVGAANAA